MGKATIMSSGMGHGAEGTRHAWGEGQGAQSSGRKEVQAGRDK